MKQRNSTNLAAALAAVCGPPLLLFLQSRWSVSPASSRPERTPEEIRFEPVSEWAAWAREGHSESLIRLAEYYRRCGREETAEAWLRHGAIQLRNPALMLYFGDYLCRRRRHGDLHAARLLYRRVLALAERDRQKEFADVVRQRLASLEKEATP